jgi:NAD(P)-dependent dehydrogenase (short-subunit alcohol dehydrogenase family)
MTEHAAMAGRLAGKVALVTGAGRRHGIGQAIVRRFMEEGARVMIADIGRASGPLLPASDVGTMGEMEAVAAELRTTVPAGAVATVACDVRDEAEVEHAVERTIETFGVLDILVNNAGIGYIARPLVELPLEEWDLVQSVNLRGAFLCTKHAARRMIGQVAGGREGGRIINIASKGAKAAIADYGAYAASKHGLLGLTRVAALELAPHGITVNAVCPNHVTTGLGERQNRYRARRDGQDVDQVLHERRTRIPLGRVGRPEDTAEACLFLASRAASYITGEAMNVSGGEEMR